MTGRAVSVWLKLVLAPPMLVIAAWIHEPVLVATWLIVIALGLAQLVSTTKGRTP